MALQRLRGKEQVQPAPVYAGDEEQIGFPRWVISDITHFLDPFWDRQASYDLSFPSRDFVREAERNLRLTLDWSRGHRGAAESLWKATYNHPELLVGLVDFGLRNIIIGHPVNRCAIAAGELNRALHESGAAWELRKVKDRLEYFLERRVGPAASSAVMALRSVGGPEAAHMGTAWERAFGRSPDPGKAYEEALKAVEAVAIPVVLPNDATATLGKVIGALRANPSRWSCTVTESTAQGQAPLEVAIAMLDLLMKNHTDRHPPIVAITQAQADSAVHMALTLVQLFRSGAIAKK